MSNHNESFFKAIEELQLRVNNQEERIIAMDREIASIIFITGEITTKLKILNDSLLALQEGRGDPSPEGL